MFCNLATIIPEEMKKDCIFWEKAWKYIKNIDCNYEKFSLRTVMRLALIQSMCEDELKLSPKEKL